MQKSHDITKKQFLEIVVVSVILGLGIFISDYVNDRVRFDGTIERNSAGSGELNEELKLSYKDEKEQVTVAVSEQSLNIKEIEAAFEKAVKEINETYLGKNESADNVQFDLDIRKSYVDGLIQAKWQFDDYDIISTDGLINQENVAEEGNIVEAKVELSYENETKIYDFSFVARPLDLSSKEGQKAAIENALKAADEKTKDSKEFILPTEAEGMVLDWKRNLNFRGIELMILGIAMAFGLKIGAKQDEKRLKESILKEKERDYPMIVSELSILMGAGMSFRKALERLTESYQKRRISGLCDKKAGYEEMVCTYRQITDGLGEISALENLGMRSEQKEYRKLSMLISQNIRKGSKELINSLEKEEINAFNMRKQRAIRLGEEASTKLLLPMGGMLVIVMVILIAPAIMQMNI